MIAMDAAQSKESGLGCCRLSKLESNFCMKRKWWCENETEPKNAKTHKNRFRAGVVNEVLALILGNCAQRSPLPPTNFPSYDNHPRRRPHFTSTESVAMGHSAGLRAGTRYAFSRSFRQKVRSDPLEKATKKKLDWEQ